MNPRAGTLRTIGHIKRPADPADTRDDSGGFTETPLVEVGTRKMHVKALSGREFMLAQQVSSDITHKITMRWPRAITVRPKDRIEVGQRVFELIGPADNVEELGDMLTVSAKEVI